MAETALITGASAGLGLEFARLFAADKQDLVLVARRKDRLDALAAELSAAHGIRVHVIAADLMDPAAPEAILAQVKRLGLAIDTLVNNAGFGAAGPLAQMDAAKVLGQVQVNVTALVVLTRGLLPDMVARGRGRIFNIGSTAGFQPGPYMAVYYATKAFVNSFTEALWFELKGTGVTATVSCPGATATEFAGVAGTDKSNLFKKTVMGAALVARQGYDSMRSGKPVIIHGFKNRFLAWSVGWLPRGPVLAATAKLNQSSATSAPKA